MLEKTKNGENRKNVRDVASFLPLFLYVFANSLVLFTFCFLPLFYLPVDCPIVLYTSLFYMPESTPVVCTCSDAPPMCVPYMSILACTPNTPMSFIKFYQVCFTLFPASFYSLSSIAYKISSGFDILYKMLIYSHL